MPEMLYIAILEAEYSPLMPEMLMLKLNAFPPLPRT
jgi:hypothetical protein